jgi:hypothetical protein
MKNFPLEVRPFFYSCFCTHTVCTLSIFCYFYVFRVCVCFLFFVHISYHFFLSQSKTFFTCSLNNVVSPRVEQ